MANNTYNPNKGTKLSALKLLAQRTDARLDVLERDTLVGVKVNDTALQIADRMVNILIGTGETNGTIKVNNVEVAIKGLAAMAYKANVSEAELAEALATKINGKADATSVYTKQQIDGMVASVYKPAGSVAFASLPALTADVLGNVYNVTNAFTTTADFVEGANKKHPAGTNVVVVNTGTTEEPVYKYDVLAGFVDLSDYAKTADIEENYVQKNGTDRLMTAAEGEKLDGIREGATKTEASTTNGYVKVNGSDVKVYEHPTTTAQAPAFRKIGKDADGHVDIGDNVAKTDLTNLIGAATTTEGDLGLMSAADKSKLDGIDFATDDEVNAMLDEVYGAASNGGAE